jgi:hypothetical protein
MPTKKNTPKKSKLKAKNTPRKPLVEKPRSKRVSELTEPHINAASDAYGGGAQSLIIEEPSTKIFVLGFIVGLFFGASGMLIFMRLMG